MIEDFIRERMYLKGVALATVLWHRDSFRAFQGALDSKTTIVHRIEELMRRGVKSVSINTYLRAVNAYLWWRHSLRAGHATSSASASGASERSIMNQTGHRSVQMVRRYVEGSLFRENSAGKLGL
jgi:integrase